ncbi:MAG: peptide chain release factor N(5)-glutamine methyltransferase [Deltaproteobacteria bacterium]|nr:MAG: peptide chain release factor N(5)-glutamine methyltransferase [Deltaproteobacteria bacterium]
MPEESWTVLKLLDWTTDYFKKNNVAEPRASAEVLLANVLSQDRLFLYLNFDRPMEAQELSAYRASIKRRLAGEPSQYITGTQEFWSLPLRVSPDVLIPRPETEVLVEAVLDFVRHELDSELNYPIMDLGTGSGAIAIALARELPEAEIVAVDVSMPALKLAQNNAHLNQVDRKIHFLCSDMFSGFSPGWQKFTVVVTNPPYVSQAEFAELPPEIRDYEPRHALDGGVDGLSAIRRILREVPAVLCRKGALVMEMGADQAESVSALVRDSQHYQSHRIIKDYSGIDRVLLAVKK